MNNCGQISPNFTFFLQSGRNLTFSSNVSTGLTQDLKMSESEELCTHMTKFQVISCNLVEYYFFREISVMHKPKVWKSLKLTNCGQISDKLSFFVKSGRNFTFSSNVCTALTQDSKMAERD